MTVERKIIKGIPSSFVFSNMKLEKDRGAGEAKLFVGGVSSEGEYDEFFEFGSDYKYLFNRSNLLQYLHETKMECVFQKINQYKAAGLASWKENYNSILGLDEKDFFVSLTKFTDTSRYYVRADEEVFKKIFRKIAVPKLSDVVFEKDTEAKTIEINVVVNYDYSAMREEEHDDIQVHEDGMAENILYYGVPGSGKSHTIDQLINGELYERVVFHPDYTYSDFVGQIMPKLEKTENDEEKLAYKFIPGPFTKIMKEANKAENKDKMFYLVIEEINRGNAPAIFGDIFQLLDRKENGEGKYHITNFDIAREVYGNEDAEVRIPSNLSILATMNTSDQNVFTLDTAFQRRWNMKYIDNDVNAAEHADVNIEGSRVTWGQFANVINDEILEANAEMLSSEDKQLGAYFVEKDELSADKFPEKALKYLWDDAFKMERDKIFDPNIKSIGNLVTAYTDEVDSGRDPIARVMKEDVYKRMMDLSAKTVKEAFADDEVFEARKDD